MCEQAKVCKALVQVRLLTRIAAQKRNETKSFSVLSFARSFSFFGGLREEK